MDPLRRALLGGAAALLALPIVGCGGSDEELVLVGGNQVSREDIDRDPLALLPSKPIAVFFLDAATMFSSPSGAEAGRLMTNLLPLGPESNFVPSRDVTRAYGGVYAMQGADFVAILQGRFDEEAIRRSADAGAQTAFGAPLVKTRYADRDLYVAGNVGFTVLTAHTVLAGNEIGIRRALDRLRYDKLERKIPSWMIELAGAKSASFAVAADLESQPAVRSAASTYPMLAGLKVLRVLGNFQPPGLNFAGTLTYEDPQSASNGASALKNLASLANVVSLVTSWGFGGVPQVQIAQRGSDVAFTMPVDDRLLRLATKLAADWTTRR